MTIQDSVILTVTAASGAIYCNTQGILVERVLIYY